MRRIHHGTPRPGWAETNRSLGLVFNDTVSEDGSVASYWREGPFYDFDLDEILTLEQAAATLHRMCVAAGDRIVEGCPRTDAAMRREAYLTSVCTPRTCLLSRAGVPEYVHEQVIRTWYDNSPQTWTHSDKDLFGTHAHTRQSPDFSPHVYGRFDIWYGGRGTTPKLLEYNAQTPTSLLEAAVVQWRWLEETGHTHHYDRQWTSVHERLIEAWRRNLGELVAARPWLPQRPTVWFAYDGSEASGEDLMNAGYLAETARQAGYPVELIEVAQIGVDMADGRIVYEPSKGAPATPIDVIFLLYPWEWLWHEEGGRPIFANMADPAKRGTVWIEPPWTAALWSNKALLPVLWELYRDDPVHRELLLPAYFADERPADMTGYARKPIWSREGANVELVRDGIVLASTGGDYGDTGMIVQGLAELPTFDGPGGPYHPVLGVWMIDGEPAGMGIREGAGTDGLITRNGACFTPHTIGSHRT
ncbi:glutathionylspermidine synthase family protein [Catellatospora chokoriensis]|uniref:Glutathionylspermidine synthase n=1 Tax=Catellatospora chokoriensis TaxID=310353 RepID=A0A8J3JVH0_9ACTN|nr:glutathionylspermidine synthase family protein [Catellatospora chokoriensis]GIF91832.1 glutathionylspermidine synthase [Catellatospora chokoriensis]